ncbi:MAG: hypothetical protein QOF57_1214 [Frankiaceae bacterium]|nr:hypothetical protein [Frankiaceae bacterium]
MSSPDGDLGVPRLTAAEVAWGWPYGVDPSVPRRPRGPQPAARAVFERIIRDALASGTCAVAFSGGRDSSAVLAVAVEVARREGLALPAVVTFDYPGDGASDERGWQELVIRHLAVDDWTRIDATEGTDLLGPTAARALLAAGRPIFPSGATLWPWRVEQVPADVWLTGELGDNVMGVQRTTALTHLIRRRGRVPAAYWRAAAAAVAPAPLWARYAARTDEELPWLRPDVAELRRAQVHDEALAEPRWWDDGVWHVGRMRAITLGTRAAHGLVASAGAAVVEPFGDPDFRAAWAKEGGRLGFSGRTAAMRHLFADVLPDALLDRATKATFNASVVGPATTAFIDGWTGDGVDPVLVDPDRLRENWRTGSPHALSFPLMQQAFLAQSAARNAPSAERGS